MIQTAPRIYNIHPLLAGPVETWSDHLPRVRAMGFDWLYVNAFFASGSSGSIYAAYCGPPGRRPWALCGAARRIGRGTSAGGSPTICCCRRSDRSRSRRASASARTDSPTLRPGRRLRGSPRAAVPGARARTPAAPCRRRCIGSPKCQPTANGAPARQSRRAGPYGGPARRGQAPQDPPSRAPGPACSLASFSAMASSHSARGSFGRAPRSAGREVVEPAALRSGRHQGRDPVLGQAFDLGAVRITIVGQGHLGPAQRGGDRLDRGQQLTPIAGALADPGAQDQLAAFGVHHGLRMVGLAVLVALALAHQPAVGVGKVALRVWPRRVVRRLGMLALGPPCAALAHCHLGLVIRPLRRSAHLGLGLEALAGGIQLGAQRRQAPDLLGQGLRSPPSRCRPPRPDP